MLRAQPSPTTATFDDAEPWRAHLRSAFQDLVPEADGRQPTPCGCLSGVRLGPGELAVYDTGRPYKIRLEGAWTSAVMALPRDAIDLAGRDLDGWMHRVYPATAGTDVAGTGAAGDLRASVLRYVRAHLGDPALSRSAIAAAYHMSTRTLDRLFADGPQSVSELIRHERLAAARRDLADPALRNRSVAGVAARWGFFDAAHFSRMFRQLYGHPPSQRRPGGPPHDGRTPASWEPFQKSKTEDSR